ncbi:sensor domain-containing protein [Mycolicibacterium fortuitum]|uniref:sensor domain-containing protein n=1 Tax=Mycolicibacterium fortuitum TaxID=1766 RepID=UPI00094414CE|nr:sensor domain-containing protein [Mycolicibacterium fortuitum]UBV16316.1 sensor domain-containing protein [Mycolicibacterium fortuitum]
MATQDPFGGSPFGQYPPGQYPPPGQPPYGGPPMVPAGPPPRDEANTLATLSVVFAFVFAPAGAVLGHLGLSQIKRTGQRGRDRALVGLTVSYTLIVVAVAALVIWAVVPSSSSTTTAEPTKAPTTSAPATTTTPAPPPLVTEAQLAGLLPSLAEVKEITKNTELVVDDEPQEIGLPPAPHRYDPVECASSFSMFTPLPYENSGYLKTASATQYQSPKPDLQAYEGVAMFADAAAAERVLARYLELWRGCAGKTFTWTIPDGRSTHFLLGGPEDQQDGIIALRSSNQGSESWMLRAIGAKANVVVDVHALGVGLTDEAVTVVKRILDRIPG